MHSSESVRTAELELMSSATRRNSSRLQALLHGDFIEIGRSGRRWNRDEMIAALAQEGDRSVPVVDEWEFTDLSSDLVLVTYRARNDRGQSRHASIWDVGGRQPQIRFHQGTVIAAVAEAR